MGIGRREFLKAFGATIAAYAAGPLQPVVLGGECYINRSLGLAFRQPPGWNYVLLKQFPLLRNEQVLEDNEISRMLLSGADPYVVMDRRDPGSPGPLAASMTAYVEEFAFEPGESLSQVPTLAARALALAVREHELLEQSAVFRLSGTESIEYFARFRFETPDVSVLARHRSLVGVKGGAIFTFNFFDYPEQGIDGQADFDAIRASITYA
ncbi:hypothetical protein [Arenimonas terrae]|jgi:hypothetical protein|uniref:DUF1795 domain-containing protein n=1 Tax=Arenimonas terrae TaxID=2546226 RepID=A0A5C4RWB5_9GAMM|nr:hypothetical protein [Arenimonas terrae]TNJ34987.1 hypothetical protein E1B00_04200 [Arenimonas terrae]